MSSAINEASEVPIEKLGFSNRAFNALKRNNIDRLDQLLELSPDELMQLRHIGHGTIKEILRVREEALKPAVSHDVFSVQDAEQEATLLDKATLLYDMQLSDLGLSVRSYGALKREGVNTLSELMILTEDDLLHIRNLGRTSVEEILRVRTEKTEQQRVIQNARKNNSENQSLETEVLKAIETIAERLQLNPAIVAHQVLIQDTLETAVRDALHENPLRTAFDNAILSFLEQAENGAAFSEIADSFGKAFPVETIQTCLEELSEDGRIRFDEGAYKRFYPSVISFVESLTDERARTFLQQRLAGKTLEEVGTENDVTRERVRQICKKFMRLRPRLYEDRYRIIYERYEWSRADFYLAFGEPDYVFLYLQMVYRHGEKPIEQILTDEEVSAKFRRRAERAVYKNDIFIDGMRLHRTRQNLMRYAVRRYCTEQTRFEDFLEYYSQMLQDLSLEDDEKLVIHGRTYENHILNCDYALWIYPRTLRAYSVDEVDKEAFWDAINLSQYMNMTISTELVFRDHNELMLELNIHDSYELHNLMRKLYPEEQTLIKFGRQPMITVGNGDLQTQLLDLLLQYAPISAEELGKKCREHFGILEQTAMGSYFRYLDEYYHDGVYRIDADNLPPDRYTAMQNALPGDIYTIQKIRGLYCSLFPDANISDINPYTLKTLGFRVYSSFVIRNKWQNARAYFTHLLLENGVANLREMDNAIISHVTFLSTLYELKATREIIEFAPRQYVSIGRLEKNGVTRADLQDYCQKAAAYVGPGRFFTVTSLQNAGFRHSLDEIGFDEWFYSSVLIEDRAHFSYRRYGRSKLLYSGNRDVQLKDFLAALVEREPMELYDLLELLQREYGLTFSTSNLLKAVRDSDMYYDPIMEKIYPDYDTYYEEI